MDKTRINRSACFFDSIVLYTIIYYLFYLYFPSSLFGRYVCIHKYVDTWIYLIDTTGRWTVTSLDKKEAQDAYLQSSLVVNGGMNAGAYNINVSIGDAEENIQTDGDRVLKTQKNAITFKAVNSMPVTFNYLFKMNFPANLSEPDVDKLRIQSHIPPTAKHKGDSDTQERVTSP